MRIQLYFLLPFLFIFRAYSQPGFNKIYDLGAPNSTLINGILDHDTLFAIGGVVADSLPGVYGICLLETDTNGNTLNVYPYFDVDHKDLGFAERADLIRLSNGDMVTCGSYFSEFNLFLARYTTQGAVASFVKIPLANTTSFAVYELSSYLGGYLIQGGLITLQNRYNTFLLRIDFEGNVIWEKRYSPPGMDEASVCMTVLENNTILIGSTVGNFLSSPYINSRIYAVDSLGEIKWEWQSPANNEGLVSDIHKLPNGDWLYVNKKLQILSQSSWLGRNQLVRRDSNWNLLWAVTLSPTPWYRSTAGKLLPTPDDNWIVSEHAALIGPDFTAVYPDGMVGCLTKVSSEGEIFWQTCDSVHWDVTPTFSEESAGGHVVLPSGSVILIGHTDHYPPPTRTYGWMFKTDAGGCIYAPCSVGVEDEPVIVEERSVKVYPNPAQDRLTVQLPASSSETLLTLYNQTGAVVYRGLVPATETSVELGLSALPDGLYWLEARSEGKLQFSHKVLIQR